MLVLLQERSRLCNAETNMEYGYRTQIQPSNSRTRLLRPREGGDSCTPLGSPRSSIACQLPCSPLPREIPLELAPAALYKRRCPCYSLYFL